MKSDRGPLLLGATVIAMKVLWSILQGRRPACGGGSCCPLLPALSVQRSNPWTTVEATNGKPGVTTSESLTNRQR
jgi:hypothetical protein